MRDAQKIMLEPISLSSSSLFFPNPSKRLDYEDEDENARLLAGT